MQEAVGSNPTTLTNFAPIAQLAERTTYTRRELRPERGWRFDSWAHHPFTREGGLRRSRGFGRQGRRGRVPVVAERENAPTLPMRSILSRSSVEQSTAVRRRGSRVRGRAGTTSSEGGAWWHATGPETGPTSGSRVRLLHLPPVLAELRRPMPRSDMHDARPSPATGLKPASVKQAGRPTRGSDPRGRTNAGVAQR